MPKRISVRKAAESNFCAVGGRVDRLRRLQAIVAIAAALGRILAEMAEQDRAAAAGGLDQGGERVQPLALARLARRLDLGRDPPPGAREILGAPEQPGLGRLAVAAGAAGLLIISLDRLGQAGMGDEADVGLVDPHAEGDGRDHHHLLGCDERRLVARPDLRLEPGMIGKRRPPGLAELLGELVGLVAARHVDDAGPRLLGEQRLQLAGDAVARADAVADVGPVEAGEDQAVLGDAELDEDVLARPPVRGRGQRQPRHVREGVEQGQQQPVIGPEIVAPFGDAMRLVDRDQRQRNARDQLAKAGPGRPLGRDVEQLQFAALRAARSSRRGWRRPRSARPP